MDVEVQTITLLLAAFGGAAAFDVASAKKNAHHHDGRALLGEHVKQNGKHELHKIGKIRVTADVSNGKVVGVSASHADKGNLPVQKVKSQQKFADAASGLIAVWMQTAQVVDTYYGYCVDDGLDVYCYWFPADLSLWTRVAFPTLIRALPSRVLKDQRQRPNFRQVFW